VNYLFHVDPPSAADLGDEAAIQTRLRSRMRIHAPEVMLVAVPNGGKRTAWEAMQRSREGMAKGFPDIIALAPDGKVAFLEMKAKTGRLSPEQIGILERLCSLGFDCGCFNSVDSAMAALRRWGFPFLFQAAAA
jgi:hypothetical protein